MMGLKLLIAKRYLFSHKSHSIINIISGVSAFAVGIPVAAMIILLSVFNGLEDLVKSLYKDFDPDIVVSVNEGKVFDSLSMNRTMLLDIPPIEQVSMVMEDQALLEYRGRQTIATLRGVDTLYSEVTPISGMIVDGEYQLRLGDLQQAIVGQGIANNLGIRTNFYDPIIAYTPRRVKFNPLLPMANYSSERVFPVGIFMLEAETDSKYVIVPIEFTQKLFDYQGRYSAAMVKLKAGVNLENAKKEISTAIGDNFKVQTRYQLKESLYRIMIYEKWGIFLIIMLVLIIASFSIVGSLVMLIIEKRGDIATLRAMGADTNFIRSIFVREGVLISMIGAVGGLLLGLFFCWLQIEFGFVQIPASTLLVESYPVIVEPFDMIGVVATFTIITYIISRLTVIKMIDKHNNTTQQL